MVISLPLPLVPPNVLLTFIDLYDLESCSLFVQDLNCLTEQYLIPLQSATFLTSGEIQQLFGNIQEIVTFQQQFLISLEEAIQLEGDFFQTEDPKVFRVG